MRDAPRCPGGDWTYDSTAPCVMARRVGHGYPLIWVVGRGIVEPQGSDAPDPAACALALHILQQHPHSLTAEAVGEWETYEPLRALNEVITRMLARPRWLRFLPLFGGKR